MNYGELKTLVKDYLECDETTFNTHFPQFVRAMEEDVYRQVQLPDLRKTATSPTGIGSAFVSLPADFLSPYTLSILTGGVYTVLMSKEQNFFREAFPTDVSGAPRYYAIFDDSTIMLAPKPDAIYTLELNYFYFPTSLAEGEVDATETWLSINAENACLFGTIYQGYIFLKGDQDVAAAYKDQYEAAIAGLKIIEEGRNRKDTYRQPDKRIPT